MEQIPQVDPAADEVVVIPCVQDALVAMIGTNIVDFIRTVCFSTDETLEM
jgi:hypothetical protein